MREVTKIHDNNIILIAVLCEMPKWLYWLPKWQYKCIHIKNVLFDSLFVRWNIVWKNHPSYNPSVIRMVYCVHTLYIYMCVIYNPLGLIRIIVRKSLEGKLNRTKHPLYKSFFTRSSFVRQIYILYNYNNIIIITVKNTIIRMFSISGNVY